MPSAPRPIHLALASLRHITHNARQHSTQHALALLEGPTVVYSTIRTWHGTGTSSDNDNSNALLSAPERTGKKSATKPGEHTEQQYVFNTDQCKVSPSLPFRPKCSASKGRGCGYLFLHESSRMHSFQPNNEPNTTLSLPLPDFWSCAVSNRSHIP
jgi:hypothetical protein